MYDYSAVLRRVIDGDTYVLDIDLGFHVWTTQHIRLAGIDCPEHTTPTGVLATRFARSWFAMVNGQVILETAPGQPTTFERWVGSIHAPGQTWLSNPSLETALRTSGFVKPGV